jgi:hypothetical protein
MGLPPNATAGWPSVISDLAIDFYRACNQLGRQMPPHLRRGGETNAQTKIIGAFAELFA